MLWEGVEVKPEQPMRGVFICEDEKDVNCLRDERGGVERTESEIRGHLRLWASSSESRRSNWWSVTLRIALCSLDRRRLAFFSIVRNYCPLRKVFETGYHGSHTCWMNILRASESDIMLRVSCSGVLGTLKDRSVSIRSCVWSRSGCEFCGVGV